MYRVPQISMFLVQYTLKMPGPYPESGYVAKQSKEEGTASYSPETRKVEGDHRQHQHLKEQLSPTACS